MLEEIQMAGPQWLTEGTAFLQLEDLNTLNSNLQVEIKARWFVQEAQIQTGL